jgi:hypothetical protein
VAQHADYDTFKKMVRSSLLWDVITTRQALCRVSRETDMLPTCCRCLLHT